MSIAKDVAGFAGKGAIGTAAILGKGVCVVGEGTAILAGTACAGAAALAVAGFFVADHAAEKCYRGRQGCDAKCNEAHSALDAWLNEPDPEPHPAPEPVTV